MREAKKARTDDFFAGYCCALSAAIPSPETGTHTHYLEAVQAAGPELLAYARRTKDIELPRIRQAVRHLASRRTLRRRGPSTEDRNDG